MLSIFGVSTLVGCAETVPRSTANLAANSVEVTLVDRAEFDAMLVGLHEKVVLVDCWATWCLPCVEQLPHSIELAKRHADEGLAVVTVSLNDPDAADQVRALLERLGASVSVNLQSRFGGSPQSMNAFDIASGALPHYKLYDRDGHLRRTFDLDPAAEHQFTPSDIDAAVTKLLAE